MCNLTFQRYDIAMMIVACNGKLYMKAPSSFLYLLDFLFNKYVLLFRKV